MFCVPTRTYVGFLLGLFLICTSLWAQEPLPVTDTFQVNTYTSNAQITPDVSRSPDGQLVVVWRSYEYWDDVSGGRIRMQRLADDGTLQGDESLLHAESLESQDSQRVSHTDDGAFLVVWREFPRVMGRYYDASGAPAASPFQVNTDTAGTLFSDLGLSQGADGVAVVTWAFDRNDGAGQDIWGQRIAADGTPLGTQFLINSYTTSDQGRPEISHGPDGSFVVVWNSDGQDGSDLGVHGRRFDRDGLPVSDEFQINTQTAAGQFNPRVSHSPNGEFVVIWTELLTPRRIFGQRFDAGGQAAGSEFEVAPSITNSKFRPVLTHDSHGDFLVVWADVQADFEYDPLGQRFSAQGLPLGDPFAVSPFIPGEQSFPQIASGPAGSLAVVWTSEEEGVANFEIFARLFCSDHDADQACDGLLDDGFESGDLSRWSNAVPTF